MLEVEELGSFSRRSLKVRILTHEGLDSQGGVLKIEELVTFAS